MGRILGECVRQVLICLLCFSVWPSAVTGQEQAAGIEFEEAPIRKAGDILPEEMVSGPTFRVLDNVGSFDSLNLFTVESEFGEIEIYGEPMLRIRLREMKALETLRATTTAKAAGQAAGRTATKSFKSLGAAIAHPVRTAKGVPKGVSRLFKSVGRDVNEVVDDTQKLQQDSSVAEATASKYGKKLVGIDKAERRWAKKVGVDPYSTNEALGAELRRVAEVDAAASIGTKLIAPSLPELAKVLADVSETVYDHDWRELFDLNWAALAEMGATPEQSQQFFDNEPLTPSLDTLIVSSLEEMDGVADRPLVIEQAALLESESEAVFFAESVMLASWFHTDQTPLERMVFATLIPVGMTADGRLIAFTAADDAYWTRTAATAAVEFHETYQDMSEQREVWIAGHTSTRFRQAVEGLGWTVRDSLREELLPLVPWGVGGSLADE